MDEFFWGMMAILLLFGILAAPIATFFLCLGIRRRQQELAADLARWKTSVDARLPRREGDQTAKAAADVPSPAMAETATPPPPPPSMIATATPAAKTVQAKPIPATVAEKTPAAGPKPAHPPPAFDWESLSTRSREPVPPRTPNKFAGFLPKPGTGSSSGTNSAPQAPAWNMQWPPTGWSASGC